MLTLRHGIVKVIIMEKSKFKLQINTAGMAGLLARHVYSTPGVFVREFLQNAADAIAKRSMDDGMAPRRIDVCLVKARGKKAAQVIFSDSGTGMTPDEIKSLLSVAGLSSKPDNIHAQDYMGAFGLGILSGFLVSDSIEFRTRKAGSLTGCVWTAGKDGFCRMGPAEVEETGSSVTLKCKKGAEDFFTENTLKSLLRLYGNILPYPVRFSADGALPIQINEIAPPWLTPGVSGTGEIMAYGENYFGERFMGYIPLKSETGGVEGVAYILDRRATPGSKGNHRVYLRNILLTEKGEGLLPGWAFFLRAVVNVQNLTPTLSREDFCDDTLLKKTRTELWTCIKDYFAGLAGENDPVMDRFMTEHLIGLKLVALENEEVLRVFMDYFPFETSLGTFTFREIKEVSQTIRYVNKVDEFRQLAPVFGSGGQMLVNAGYAYDAEMMTMLSFYNPSMRIERIGMGDIFPAIRELPAGEDKTYAELRNTASKYLARRECRVEIKKFRPVEMPALFLKIEEASFVSDIKYDEEGGKAVLSDLFDHLDRDDGGPEALLCLNAGNSLIKRMAETNYNGGAAFDMLYVLGMLMAHRQLGDTELAVINNSIGSIIESKQSNKKRNT